VIINDSLRVGEDGEGTLNIQAAGQASFPFPESVPGFIALWTTVDYPGEIGQIDIDVNGLPRVFFACTFSYNTHLEFEAVSRTLSCGPVSRRR